MSVPLAVMTYYNTVHHAGHERFAAQLAEAGIVAEPVPRQFDDPPTALPSFSRFWQRVVPKAEVGRSWHR